MCRFGGGKQFVGVRLDLPKRMDGAGKVERVRKGTPVFVLKQHQRLLQDFQVVHHSRTAQRQDIHEGLQFDGFARLKEQQDRLPRPIPQR